MGYYTINKKIVFITWDRDKKIRDIAKTGKNPMWNISSRLRGTKENKDLDKFCYDYLVKEEQKNPKDFESDWINFHLKDEGARNNVWDLLYDYCIYYGHSRLIDQRTPSEKIEQDYSHESYYYPMGKVFAIQHIVRPYRWWWKYSKKMSNRKIKVIINIEKVKEIEGTLDNFRIKTSDAILVFNKDFEVYL